MGMPLKVASTQEIHPTKRENTVILANKNPLATNIEFCFILSCDCKQEMGKVQQNSPTNLPIPSYLIPMACPSRVYYYTKAAGQWLPKRDTILYAKMQARIDIRW